MFVGSLTMTVNFLLLVNKQGQVRCLQTYERQKTKEDLMEKDQREIIKQCLLHGEDHVCNVVFLSWQFPCQKIN